MEFHYTMCVHPTGDDSESNDYPLDNFLIEEDFADNGDLWVRFRVPKSEVQEMRDWCDE